MCEWRFSISAIFLGLFWRNPVFFVFWLIFTQPNHFFQSLWCFYGFLWKLKSPYIALVRDERKGFYRFSVFPFSPLFWPFLAFFGIFCVFSGDLGCLRVPASQDELWIQKKLSNVNKDKKSGFGSDRPPLPAVWEFVLNASLSQLGHQVASWIAKMAFKLLLAP